MSNSTSPAPHSPVTSSSRQSSESSSVRKAPTPQGAAALHPQGARLLEAFDEIAHEVAPLSLVFFHGDRSPHFRAHLLRGGAHMLEFLWPTPYGLVAACRASEQDAVIWAEQMRLRWPMHMAVGVSEARGLGDRPPIPVARCFTHGFLAMSKAVSLGGAFTLAASSLLDSIPAFLAA